VPDVVLLHTSRRQQQTVSLGTEVNILPAAIEAVRQRGGLVIAQANTRMPYTFGDAEIDESSIDYLVEVDEPLATKLPTTFTDETRQIGELIAARISDGSTLQLGIGAIPDSVLGTLADRKSMRIWTEMFSDGVLEMARRGSLAEDIPITASFVFGGTELYKPGAYACSGPNDPTTRGRSPNKSR
jgi:acyl-CoA hydrolase